MTYDDEQIERMQAGYLGTEPEDEEDDDGHPTPEEFERTVRRMNAAETELNAALLEILNFPQR